MNKISIILNAKSKEGFTTTVESINKQDIDLSQIEIILINNCNLNPKELKMINATCKLVEKSSLMDQKNQAIKCVSGDYVTFIDSGYCYSSISFFSSILSMLNNNPIITVPVVYRDDDTLVQSYHFNCIRTNETYDLKDNYININTNLECYFFRKDLISNFTIDVTNEFEVNSAILIHLLSTCSKIVNYSEVMIISHIPFDTNTSSWEWQYHKQWYLNTFSTFWLRECQNASLWLQYYLLYEVYLRINCNIQDKNKGVLNDNEFLDFQEQLKCVLALIDDEVILNTKKFYKNNKQEFTPVTRGLMMWLMDLKYYNYRKKIAVVEDNSQYNLQLQYVNDQEIKCNKIVSSNKREKFEIAAINYANGKLSFDCISSISDLIDEKEIKLVVKNNGSPIPVIHFDVFSLFKVFNKTIYKEYPFKFSIDISKETLPINLTFYLVIDNIEISLKPLFTKIQARLSNITGSFWHYKDFVLENKTDRILITKYNCFKLIIKEIAFFFHSLKETSNKPKTLAYLFLRFLYYITIPFLSKKHIWITSDKLYKAGDNGEYIFHYGLEHHKNIYYIIRKDSIDYQRMVKQDPKHILPFRALKTRIYSLHSEVFLATHISVASYCTLGSDCIPIVSGIFRPEIVCIQHGLTIQKIAQYQNRLLDNTKQYYCASYLELENLKLPIYGYEHSQLKLTGLARFDGLVSNNQRIILISPTWRRNVVNEGGAFIKKGKNQNFKSSMYYKIYNGLINNERLIKVAKEKNYKIIYLLHPAMSPQIDDYEKNDYVEIIAATGDMNYEKVLTESSLMVTDYSGIQFDFAYQRKPVIYFHPSQLPPHYDVSLFIHEKHGFGPVIDNERQLIDELCDYMNNNCQMKKEYIERTNQFFAYSDHNNCKRIVAAVDEYLNSLQ